MEPADQIQVQEHTKTSLVAQTAIIISRSITALKKMTYFECLFILQTEIVEAIIIQSIGFGRRDYGSLQQEKVRRMASGT